ncbi:DEAD/DEAH box helicase, partial [Sutterella sp.]|uniref:DEAD/DEAH box helicase n=1 Tax=Sutterella sp. TaxID=1981025 RepID=UPI0026DFBD67
MTGGDDRRGRALETLRFWEEIELLTPPDYRDDEDENLRFTEWRPGRLVAVEKLGVSEWEASRLREPFDYPASDSVRRRLGVGPIPFFTVYVGLLPKRTVYERILEEFGEESPEGEDPDLVLDHIREETASGAQGAAVDIQGRTYLASFDMTPWGKYVDGSFHASGFAGALRHLVARRQGATLAAVNDGDNLVALGLSRCERMANWFTTEVARTLGQVGTTEPGRRMNVTQLSDTDPKMVRLEDPHPEAEPVPEGFIGMVAQEIARSIGIAEDLPSAVSVSWESPTRRTPSRGGAMTGSFFLGDLSAARRSLEIAGSVACDAPMLDGMTPDGAEKDAVRERVSAVPASLTEAPPETVVEARMKGFDPLTAGDFIVADPISAPLSRILFLGDAEGIPRIDLLRRPDALAQLLAPADLPSGRWPAPSGHHLYIAQQAAVAAILRAGEGTGPLVSVNGPPGTGKSWLLRDIVAEIVTRRARRIAAKNSSREVFDTERPVAFRPEPNRVETLVPFAADVIADSLIVVASSNNAAIRNITDALPRSYGLREPVPDGSGRTRPAFTYWRDCALGLLALSEEGRGAGKGRHGKAGPENLPSLFSRIERERARSRYEAAGGDPAEENARRRRTRDEIRQELRSRVKRTEEVWGLASATLGNRANCARFARAVSGLGKANPFDSTIQQQIDDALLFFSETRNLPEDVWNDARKAFIELDRKIGERRRSMAERGQKKPPRAFSVPLADEPVQHKQSLWVDEEFERMRSELFEAALRLHAATLVAQADVAKKSLRAACAYLLTSNPVFESGSALDVFETLGFLVPVLSTTLASASRIFSQIGASQLPWVLIDEASQASPQAAVGMLNRARRAVVLGDLRQLMPVVTMPPALAEYLRARRPTVGREWSPLECSLQSLADASMQIGAEIGGGIGSGSVWSGLPLRTHRRCGSPMFDIANTLSYGGQMVQMTPKPFDGLPPLSQWYDVRGESYVSTARTGTRRTGDPKMIREEMAWLRHILKKLITDPDRRGMKIFVLSPFRSVAAGARRIIGEIGRAAGDVKAGTVHTFQGQEADLVILVLGSAPGARGRRQRAWASSPANLLTVAVTRARRDLIVVGDWGEWTLEPTFRTLANEIPRMPVDV